MYHISRVVGYDGRSGAFLAQGRDNLRMQGAWTRYGKVELSKDGVVQGIYPVSSLKDFDIFERFTTYTVEVDGSARHNNYIIYDKYAIKLLEFIDSIDDTQSDTRKDAFDIGSIGKIGFSFYDQGETGIRVPIFFEEDDGRIINLLDFLLKYPPYAQETYYQTSLYRFLLFKFNDFEGLQRFFAKVRLCIT